ncbi:alpha/beta hydrolase [Streptomyces sp. 11x1]|uniref:alpha/beta hydrolase n=1 Tax=Streptomyces sp. 11x1 TaxID=3038642 RepID=UPI00292CAFFD|nr:alpha/beta hydrolase [Streptomyces sp. 11x1]WNZ06381.1 alpha/beta hydrolase [Streptomyces sp. 11x1]
MMSPKPEPEGRTEVTPLRPPFDPELAALLPGIRQAMGTAGPESLGQMRQAMDEGVPGVAPPDLTAGGRLRIEDIAVPESQGSPGLILLVATPSEGSGPWPCIYHIHGGGMVTGNRRTGFEQFAPIAAEQGAVIVSVEYRLAPENPDPAPVSDCYQGLLWTARNAPSLNIDPARIMITGSSAGGGLAAGTALMARDHGFPRLSHQILMYPMLDDRALTVSSRMLQGEGVWTAAENDFGWTSLLGERRGSPDVSPYAAPARATDLRGLPRTFLDCGSVDTFRDEVLDYARKLSAAGVSVDLHLWGGGFHGFDVMAPHTAISQSAIAAREDFIKRALKRCPPDAT